MLLTAAVTSWQPHTERKRCSGVRSGSSSEHCGRYMRGHRRPAQPPTANWQPLVDSYLSSYAGGVSRSDVDYAEAWAANASQFTAAGSWRARVVNGSLWVRPIHFYEHWKERASVLRILLLAAQQASALGEPLPDSELVFAAADSDPTVLHSRRRCHAPNTSATLHGRRRTRPAANCPRLPVFVHARASALGSTALPLPEYSWVGSYHSPPWCQMQPRFERAAAAWGWEQRDARAYFGGACSTGISRQSLLPLNRTHGELLHVLDVGFGRSGFVNPHDVERAKRSYARLGVGWGNFSAQLPPDYACRFQVLLSVPGFGYSNRLRQLLACGSAVVHVQHQSHEFFEPLLKSGVHYLTLPGGFGTGGGETAVRSVRQQLVPLLRALRSDGTQRRRLGRAAAAFARSRLTHAAAVSYARALLTAYGTLYRSEVVAPSPADSEGGGFFRIDSARDLLRAARMCDCAADNARHTPHAARPRHEARCTLGGGIACHPFPRGSSGCWAARCCAGWDCPTKALGCPKVAAGNASRM
mmetsp:Transcript_26463/g.79085  ORF Transcript_26463/g.79085 Transcript_26463/m.79085 type:complete len:528 (+) Transcript_26463:105-1688(+)